MTTPSTEFGRRNLILLLLTALVCLAVATFIVQRDAPGRSSSDKRPREPFVRDFSIFGSYGRISFWAPARVAGPASDRIVTELQRLHNTVSVFDPESELSRLNRTAASTPFACSLELWALLQECRRAFQETGGAFDISVGPLMKLWGFHRKQDLLPTEAAVGEALEAVGLDKITFDDAERTVRFHHPETRLDMGGIAKGYGLDLAATVARRYGIRSGVVDLGGNIRCLDEPPPGRSAYVIGIRDPFNREGTLGMVQILDCSVGTSGNYEQHVMIEDKRIQHIIDPRTGHPVPDVASVTVITPRGVDSDVYSTAIFVGGKEMVETLRANKRRTSVLHVTLNPRGKSEEHRYGWVWQEDAPRR